MISLKKICITNQYYDYNKLQQQNAQVEGLNKEHNYIIIYYTSIPIRQNKLIHTTLAYTFNV